MQFFLKSCGLQDNKSKECFTLCVTVNNKDNAPELCTFHHLLHLQSTNIIKTKSYCLIKENAGLRFRNDHVFRYNGAITNLGRRVLYNCRNKSIQLIVKELNFRRTFQVSLWDLAATYLSQECDGNVHRSLSSLPLLLISPGFLYSEYRRGSLTGDKATGA
jgi:hypothetical protein